MRREDKEDRAPSSGPFAKRPALGKGIAQSLARWTYAQCEPTVQERLDQLHLSSLNEFGTDAFGFDPEFTKAAIAPFVWLYQRYFRVETQGIENLRGGRLLLVGNHSGQIPIDASMVGLAAFLEADPPRVIRSMYERWVPRLPYISIFMQRVGQVIGTPANCKKLLEQEQCILVFPEGARGVTKPFRKRYRLEPFGLGFMRLALETATPIVPVAIIGAEEQYISIGNLETLAKTLGLPGLPVLPQLLIPLLGWAPLPTKYRIRFGDPMYFTGDPDDEDAEIEKKALIVKERIESLLAHGLEQRRSVFF